MSQRLHHYRLSVAWTGNDGSGTSAYRAYRRDHTISAQGKADIRGSSDPAFLGDPSCWNPEELLLASASACHKLWYLHLCADAGVVVTNYIDSPEGTMLDSPQGGKFKDIVLKPTVTITNESDRDTAMRLHHDAHKYCHIANSVNFPILCEATIRSANEQ